MIEIGATIFLELQEDDEKETKPQRFRCRLVDRTETNLVIDYPINENTQKPSFFFDGTEFRASFVGNDQAVYSFDTEIVGRKKINIPVLFIKNPGEDRYTRIQRRNYVRVETSVDVAVHPTSNEFAPFRSITVDISGGGCAVVIPPSKSLPEKGEIELWLALTMQSGEMVYVKTICKIIRIIKTANERERASLQFSTIADQDQQKIIRFCFERQLLLRRKEQI